jgi:PhnB protein
VPVLMNAYLGFADQAREAMEFYHGVFGGTLSMTTFGEFGQTGTDAEHLIMHAKLETPEGMVLMASDAPPGMPHDEGSAISMSLSGDDEALLRRYWDALADGGTVTLPLERQMWGDVFGMCTDRFGTAWMVNIAAPA